MLRARRRPFVVVVMTSIVISMTRETHARSDGAFGCEGGKPVSYTYDGCLVARCVEFLFFQISTLLSRRIPHISFAFSLIFMLSPFSIQAVGGFHLFNGTPVQGTLDDGGNVLTVNGVALDPELVPT